MARGFDVGALRREGSEFFLTIGYHQLEGSLVALKKPLLILEKRLDDDPEARRGDGEPAAGQSGVRYAAVGVLRAKLLFKKRPKALITKPEVLAGALRRIER